MSRHTYPALLVGGNADGKRLHVDGDVMRGKTIRMASCRGLANFRPMDDFDYYHRRVDLDHEEYVFADRFGDVLLLTPRRFNRIEMLSRLVAGYQGERG